MMKSLIDPNSWHSVENYTPMFRIVIYKYPVQDIIGIGPSFFSPKD